MAINEVFRVAMVSSQRSQELIMTLGYRQFVDSPTPDMQQLADSVEEVLTGAVALWTTEFAWTSIEVRGVTNPERGLDSPILVTGTAGGDAAPMTSAMVIAKKSGLIGRTRNGRMYMPGLPESYGNSSFVSGAYLGQVNTFAENLRILVGDVVETFEAVIISTTPTLLVTPVETFLAREILGTQRRRRPGVGT